MDNKPDEALRILLNANHGTSPKAQLLEIYKLYVQMTDNTSKRRQSANSFFLTVNTAIIGVVGYIGLGGGIDSAPVSVAGIAMCYVWYRVLRSYKDLNSGKFKVIHAMESILPLSPYIAEWNILGQGRDHKIYLPFGRIEGRVPIVFALLHLVALIAVIPWYEIKVALYNV